MIEDDVAVDDASLGSPERGPNIVPSDAAPGDVALEVHLSGLTEPVAVSEGIVGDGGDIREVDRDERCASHKTPNWYVDEPR